MLSAVQALAHGTFQGSLSGVQGGNFWTSFASASISSIAASAYGGGNSYNDNGSVSTAYKGLNGTVGGGGFGMIAFSTISGGAGAALTGGNFWRGAATALIVSGLNHAMHSGDVYEDVDQEDPHGQYEPKPSKFKGLYIDKKQNDEYKSYANKKIVSLKKSIQDSNKKIDRIKSETAEIERSMSEASDGTGGDKGMGFGSIFREALNNVRIEKIEVQIKLYNVQINKYQKTILSSN